MTEAAILRLTGYLNQTRRQAEESIDLLNARILELSSELKTSSAVAEHLVEERDYYRNLSEQLKLENSKKWRLNERDDWKSLVESVQLDRTRLQEECARLESEVAHLRSLAAGPGSSSGAITTGAESAAGVKSHTELRNVGNGSGNGGAIVDSASGAGRARAHNKENVSNADLSLSAGRVGTDKDRDREGKEALPQQPSLERELFVARRRIQQLEYALLQSHSQMQGQMQGQMQMQSKGQGLRAAGANGTTGTETVGYMQHAQKPFSLAAAAAGVATSSHLMLRERVDSSDSTHSAHSTHSDSTSSNGTALTDRRTGSSAGRRQVEGERASSAVGSVWPLSYLFGAAAPQTKNATAGILFV